MAGLPSAWLAAKGHPVRAAAAAGAVVVVLAVGACGGGAQAGPRSDADGAAPAAAAEVPSNCPPEPVPNGASAVNVAIAVFTFCPPTLEVATGTQVTWTNADLVPHTATTVEGSAHPFDSGNLAGGQSFTVRLDNPGVFEYFCVLHPGMRARVVVA